MPTVTIDATLHASVPEAFAYITDYRNVPKWFYGVRTCEPVTEQTTGVGTTFSVVIQLGAKLKNTVECTVFEENERFEQRAVTGVPTHSTYVFTPTPEGGTHLRLELEYHLGRGPAGAALSKMVEPLVGMAVRQTTNALIAQLA